MSRDKGRQMHRAAAAFGLLLLSLLCPAVAHGYGGVPVSTAEAYAARAFDAARQQGPLALYAFLYRMPKGGDLHMHLSGAVYAERFLEDAAEDGLCVHPASLAFDRTPHPGGCPQGEVSAASVSSDQHLYDALIDAFSMRTFVPVTGDSGHDHFFNAFARYGGLNEAHLGEWIDEIATRAAAQNEQYLELMQTPDFKAAAALALKIGWEPNFARYREEMLAGGLRDSIPAVRDLLANAEADRRGREHCGTPAAVEACNVKVRFLYQVLRGLPREVVFAQTLLAFEAASADPEIVGLNFVMPEDGYVSMRDYALHMQMLDALHRFYPRVHISLHAGELAPGLVPPEGLAFHIRSAVEQGHAERLGHGVDVMYEDRPYDLLREMAARRVLVEVNLTSNDVILNVKGAEHPLPLYLKYRVPVALSTDDEGVSRINLTHEYVRAALTYSLSYSVLKQMVRNSIAWSFLPGAELDSSAACRAQAGAASAHGTCAEFLKTSEKARQQWELERRFRAFEAGVH